MSDAFDPPVRSSAFIKSLKQAEATIAERDAEIEKLRKLHLLAEYRADNLHADLEKVRADITVATTALAAFAACVFDDNGNITIDTSSLPSGAWKLALRLTTFEQRESFRALATNGKEARE